MRWDGYRRAFIHVGFHGTGTAALQTLLAENVAALASAGFLFPKTGRPLNLFGDGHDTWSDAIAELVSEVEREELPIVILSSELFGFSLRRPEGLADLRDALEGLGYRTYAVAYVRPQRGYAYALYRELGREGHAVGFEEFLMRVMLHREYRVGTCAMVFDYLQLLELLVSCFGFERSLVRAYAPGSARDGLPRDFLSLVSSGLTLDYDRLVPVAWEDETSSYADVLREQFTNFSKGMQSYEIVERLALEAFGDRAQQVLDTPFAPLGPRESEAFSARFAASNAEITSRFGCRLEDDPPAFEQREERRFLERCIVRWRSEFAA